MRLKHVFLSGFSLFTAESAFSQTPDATKPLPVPLTRPEMKQALEEMKGRKPRFELPPPTAEEIANAGDRGLTYEGRLRTVYLDGSDARTGRGAGGAGGTGGRENEPGASLSYSFKTQLFWIVSRTNNCLY